MIITPEILAALQTSFSAQFQGGLTAAESLYNRVATTVPSSTASNTYGWLGQFPGFREWVGDRQFKNMEAHGYQIKNKLFESTVSVKRTDIEDDNLGIYAPLFSEAGRMAAVYPDESIFGLLKTGESTPCYDGKNFFDTTHPVNAAVDGSGAVSDVSNFDSGTAPAWYLLDCSRGLKPLLFQTRSNPEFTAMHDTGDEGVFMRDEYRYGVRARSSVGFGFWQMAYKSQKPLTPDNFNAAYDAMGSQKGDGGRALGIRPTLLVVPPNLRGQALEITKADRKANGATNINAGVVETLITPWLL